MIYNIKLYNIIDGETDIPLIAFTLRKRVNADGQIETAGDITIPSASADTVNDHIDDEIRIYQDETLLWSAAFVSITQQSDTAMLKALSTAALPSPVTHEFDELQVLFVGNQYSRVRVPVDFAINPGDTIETSFITVTAANVTSRISLRESFSEISDASV